MPGLTARGSNIYEIILLVLGELGTINVSLKCVAVCSMLFYIISIWNWSWLEQSLHIHRHTGGGDRFSFLLSLKYANGQVQFKIKVIIKRKGMVVM